MAGWDLSKIMAKNHNFNVAVFIVGAVLIAVVFLSWKFRIIRRAPLPAQGAVGPGASPKPNGHEAMAGWDLSKMMAKNRNFNVFVFVVGAVFIAVGFAKDSSSKWQLASLIVGSQLTVYSLIAFLMEGWLRQLLPDPNIGQYEVYPEGTVASLRDGWLRQLSPGPNIGRYEVYPEENSAFDAYEAFHKRALKEHKEQILCFARLSSHWGTIPVKVIGRFKTIQSLSHQLNRERCWYLKYLFAVDTPIDFDELCKRVVEPAVLDGDDFARRVTIKRLPGSALRASISLILAKADSMVILYEPVAELAWHAIHLPGEPAASVLTGWFNSLWNDHLETIYDDDAERLRTRVKQDQRPVGEVLKDFLSERKSALFPPKHQTVADHQGKPTGPSITSRA